MSQSRTGLEPVTVPPTATDAADVGATAPADPAVIAAATDVHVAPASPPDPAVDAPVLATDQAAGPTPAEDWRTVLAIDLARYASRVPWALVLVLALAIGWAGEFTWLALQRHFAGGSHAEDLGFTEQVLANFLRGQWFRTSIYQGATWNTEIDLARIPRPDSLLAFHFEPMLLLLVPLYALGGISLLLALQAVAVAAGAVPAYRLGRHFARSTAAGVAVAAAYLLSPLGQWAVLADFHTSTVAAPLLLLAVERLVVKRSRVQAFLAFGLAAIAREDVGLVLAGLGLVLLLRCIRASFPSPRWRTNRGQNSPSQSILATADLPEARPVVTTPAATAESPPAAHPVGTTQTDWSNSHATQSYSWLPGLALLGLGLGTSMLGLLVIRIYNGGLPFDARYFETIGRGFGPSLAALARPGVVGYAQVLLASGGWLGLFDPLALLPAAPNLALNALSSSPWMAAGKAHYSGLVLPFIAIGAAAALRHLRSNVHVVHALSAALVLTSAVGYVAEGSGPLGGNYAPATITEHALHAERLAQSLPPAAVVSASTALVPRLSRRAHVYVFPAVLDADYVYVDVQASPSPTSAGDVFLRIQALLAGGGWQVQNEDDGLLLLERTPATPPTTLTPAPPRTATANFTEPPRGYDGGRVSLVSAELVPSPDGAVDVDGPRWILRTTWQAEEPLPRGSRLDFWLNLRDGQQVHVWDIAPLWWSPPDQWPAGQPVTIDVPDVPVREFASWQAVFSDSQP